MALDADRTDHDVITRRSGLRGVIGLLVLALLVVAVVLTFKVVSERSDRSAVEADQRRYGAVRTAAADEAEAFVNIDYRTPDEAIERVGKGATGDFAKQYVGATTSVRDVLKQNKSIMTGKVIWAGVVGVTDKTATAIVATTGTVSNTQTGNRAVARQFRFRMELQLVKGSWLTSDLTFLG